MNIEEKKIDNLSFYMISNDWSGASLLQHEKYWEPHITKVLDRNLKLDSVLVDVGSNYGWHSIMSSSKCRKIYSFEPQKLMFEIQLSSITKNDITNIEVFNCGLGEENKESEMNPIDYKSSVHIGDLSVGLGGEKIEIKTMDSIITEKVDFIKIDVQGYEKYVLLGAQQIIRNYKPTIVIEIEAHQLLRFKYTLEELFSLIRSFGYHIFFLDYFYPSDHICVHQDKVEDFRKLNSEFIKPNETNNELNHNLYFGVTEKIVQ